MLVMFGSVLGGYIFGRTRAPSNSVFTNCITGRGPRHDFGGSSNVTVSGSDRINGSSEASRLTEWANAVKPSDYEALVTFMVKFCFLLAENLSRVLPRPVFMRVRSTFNFGPLSPVWFRLCRVRNTRVWAFQNPRILFGAQTVKPDVHIRRFGSRAVGQAVGDVEALTLLEVAGEHLAWPLAGIDYAIWDTLARDRRGSG